MHGQQKVKLPSGSNAHQLCRPANCRAGWTAGDRIKKKKEVILTNGMHIRLKNRLPSKWQITRDPAL